MTPLQTLRKARPTDPFIRWRIAAEDLRDVVVDGDHVAWTREAERNGEWWGTALGEDPARVVRLIERLDASAPLEGVTVPAEAFGSLPSRLSSPDPGYWSLWFIDPTDVPQESTEAVELAGDDIRIDAVLEHSTSADTFAGDPSVRRWAGVQVDGRLVSVAAERRRDNGAAGLLSVCTVPEARGRGHARDACLLLMQRARDEGVPTIFLEMYADNEAGRRTYTALGFTEVGRYRSGLLNPR
ncbi:MAG: GNAT family N-acetyltransferase [Actinomycetota bacterium]|nr:GNAT family N-acetyltransferase [Actinomycetota bacterium]